jgi:very-short-patch-repair endonuclease
VGEGVGGEGPLAREHQDVRNRAKAMRKEPSAAEAVLWPLLRGNKLGFKFRRQHPFGAHVLDYYCPEARLDVELDGEQHKERVLADGMRDDWLRLQRIETLRIDTMDLFDGTPRNLRRVLQRITDMCEKRTGRKGFPPE